ncbi:probable sodium/metabolite cotransporter BASS1, chloroplastic [Tanacetum coccineum]
MQSSSLLSNHITTPFTKHKPSPTFRPLFKPHSQTPLNPTKTLFKQNPSLVSLPSLLHKSNTPYFPNTLLCGISSNTLSTNDENEKKGVRNWVEVVGEGVSSLFPIWVALGCLMGLVKPTSYDWVKPKWTMLGITFTMLGMGMTLTFDDLKGAFAMPKELFTGEAITATWSPKAPILIDNSPKAFTRLCCTAQPVTL